MKAQPSSAKKAIAYKTANISVANDDCINAVLGRGYNELLWFGVDVPFWAWKRYLVRPIAFPLDCANVVRKRRACDHVDAKPSASAPCGFSGATLQRELSWLQPLPLRFWSLPRLLGQAVGKIHCQCCQSFSGPVSKITSEQGGW